MSVAADTRPPESDLSSDIIAFWTVSLRMRRTIKVERRKLADVLFADPAQQDE
jgi:hypothetical protein